MSSVWANLSGRRHEAHRAALPADRRRHRRAQQLQRVRERFAIPALGAFAHHRRRHAGEARPLRRLELVRAAEEGDAERDEGQIVFLRHDEVGAVGQRGLRPCRHAQVRRLPRRWRLRPVECLPRADVERRDDDGRVTWSTRRVHALRPDAAGASSVTFLLSPGFAA